MWNHELNEKLKAHLSIKLLNKILNNKHIIKLDNSCAVNRSSFLFVALLFFAPAVKNTNVNNSSNFLEIIIIIFSRLLDFIFRNELKLYKWHIKLNCFVYMCHQLRCHIFYENFWSLPWIQVEIFIYTKRLTVIITIFFFWHCDYLIWHLIV